MSINYILNNKKYRLFLKEEDAGLNPIELTNGYFLGSLNNREYIYDAASGLKPEEIQDFIDAGLLTE